MRRSSTASIVPGARSPLRSDHRSSSPYRFGVDPPVAGRRAAAHVGERAGREPRARPHRGRAAADRHDLLERLLGQTRPRAVPERADVGAVRHRPWPGGRASVAGRPRSDRASRYAPRRQVLPRRLYCGSCRPIRRASRTSASSSPRAADVPRPSATSPSMSSIFLRVVAVEVGLHPGAEVLRLADVEDPAVATLEQVHAGGVGEGVGERDLAVVGPAARRDGFAQVAEREDPEPCRRCRGARGAPRRTLRHRRAHGGSASRGSGSTSRASGASRWARPARPRGVRAWRCTRAGRGAARSRGASRFSFTNEKSNPALWATKTAPRANSRNAGRISSIGGRPATRWSLIPVRWAMNGGIGTSGSTSAWKEPSRSPPRYFTAPTSVILQSRRRPARGLEVHHAERHLVERDALVERGLDRFSEHVPPPSDEGPNGSRTVSNRCSSVKDAGTRDEDHVVTVIDRDDGV